MILPAYVVGVHVIKQSLAIALDQPLDAILERPTKPNTPDLERLVNLGINIWNANRYDLFICLAQLPPFVITCIKLANLFYTVNGLLRRAILNFLLTIKFLVIVWCVLND